MKTKIILLLIGLACTASAVVELDWGQLKTINLGTPGKGDSLPSGGEKINENFVYLGGVVADFANTYRPNQVTTNDDLSALLVEPDGRTVVVSNGILTALSVAPGGLVTLWDTNLNLTFSQQSYLTNSRIVLGSVPSFFSARVSGVTSGAPPPSGPTPPITARIDVQLSTDGVTWFAATPMTEPVLVSLYDPSGYDDEATNLVVIGYANPQSVGSTNDFAGQYVRVDMNSTDERTVVNLAGAKAVAALEAAKWSQYPALATVNLNGQTLRYNTFWSSQPVPNFDGTLTALSWQQDGRDLMILHPRLQDSGGSNVFIVSYQLTATNIEFKMLSPSVATAPTLQWSTNLVPPWTTLSGTTNWYLGGFWYTRAPKPDPEMAFFKAFSSTNSVSGGGALLEFAGGLRFNQLTNWPTAVQIGGNSTTTNIVIQNVRGQLYKFWSNGSQVWSNSL